MNTVLLASTAAFSFTLSLLGSFNAQAVPSNAPVIGEFTAKELPRDAACGTYLSKSNRANDDSRMVYYDDLGSIAQMKIDNQIIILNATKNNNAYEYASSDGSVRVKLNLRVVGGYFDGKKVAGTILVDKNGKKVTLRVKGGTGC